MTPTRLWRGRHEVIENVGSNRFFRLLLDFWAAKRHIPCLSTMAMTNTDVFRMPRLLPPRLQSAGRAGTILALLLAGGCASSSDQLPLAAGFDGARDVFGVGYNGLTDYYIDRLDLRKLTFHGLNGLKSLDPAFAFTADDRELTLALGKTESRTFALPGDDDPYRWARLTVDVVAASRVHFAPLRDASSESIYKAVFEAELSDLDAFSRYSSAEAARQSRASREGFGGIGVTLSINETGVAISSVMPETPAARAGLRDGDRIIAAEGAPLAGLSSNDVLDRLRGPVDSTLKLAIERDGKRLDFVLKRSRIVPATVVVKHVGAAAHIRVTGFNQRTAKQIEAAVETAIATHGPGLKGMILDLRGNPGGLLDQAVHVADLFLNEGTILGTEGRHPRAKQSYRANDGDIARGMPMVVLINGGSASAAEIVAAALQDNHRALVIGSTSYGKGSVQTVMRLPNDGEMTITWARMIGPAGLPWHRIGVVPSVCTSHHSGDPAGLIADLRRNAPELGSAFAQRTQFVRQGEAAGAEAARKACPARATESDLELKVAQQLIEDALLFALASRHGQVALTP
ncbi:MAG: PDZ domain-containing protein [Alphaproteobacteria bacterium]|nr:PDZ domain-containing protein [Alphaproteobacteria bacterium]